MTTRLAQNQHLLRRYAAQAEKLPAAVRDRLEAQWGGEDIQLYALLDLDAGMRLTESWVALGPSRLAIIRPDGSIHSIDRAEITALEERPSLSGNTLILVGRPDEPALATLRYSHRQQNAIGAIAFVLKQALAGHQLSTHEPADDFYASATAKSLREAQGSVVTHKLSVVFRLLGFIRPYWKMFGLGVLGAIGLTALMLVPPLLTERIIDGAVLPAQEGEITPETAMRLGWMLIAVLAGVFVLREVFLFIRLRTLSVIGEYVARDLRRTLYDHLHTLSVSFFSRHQTGSIISRVGSDTDRIWDFIAFGLAEMIFGVILLLGISVTLVAKDWQLGLLLVLPVPLLFGLLYWMGRKLHRIFLRIWNKWSRMTATVGDAIPGIRVVQAFNQSGHERERFHARNDAVLEESIAIHRIWTTHWPLIYFGVNLMVIAVWVVGLPRMLQLEGYRAMEPGEFVAFLMLVGYFIMPLEMFGFLTRMFNRSVSSAQRVFEVLDTEPEVREEAEAIRLEPLQGHITFEEVTFGYDPVRQILKGVSFEIRPGEMIGLVGPSGAGKTTVINLIARFYDVHSGRIQVDGHDLRELELGSYRAQVGMVLQDPYLFHGSILDNIRYGKPDASEEQVLAAAQAANAHDFICKLTHSYDTLVGERGHTLSGGERQRISIARAVLHNPRVLILDEATSSVDTETEKKIQEAIDRLIAGRTVIAIAHRLSTLSRADRLIVMKDGRLAEVGTHAELLANPDGVYYNLHTIQKELHEMYAV
ncbi:MAG: ABC transporter ATP-binding protein [Verrucomicrobiota bacterium]